ncbi:MAG: hypothetical protein ABI789_01160 [Usitatibacter sp.]
MKLSIASLTLAVILSSALTALATPGANPAARTFGIDHAIGRMNPQGLAHQQATTASGTAAGSNPATRATPAIPATPAVPGTGGAPATPAVPATPASPSAAGQAHKPADTPPSP